MPSAFFGFTWERPAIPKGFVLLDTVTAEMSYDGESFVPFQMGPVPIEQPARPPRRRAPGAKHGLLLYRHHDVPSQVYHPLEEERGLFRAFAQSEPTYSGLMQFVNCYGSLGVFEYEDLFGKVTDAQGRTKGDDKSALGLTISDWVGHLLWMKDMVALWDLVREQDVDGLAERVRYSAEEVSAFYRIRPEDWNRRDDSPSTFDSPETVALSRGGGPAWRRVWTRKQNPEVFRLFEAGDLVRAALLVLQAELGTVVSDLVRPVFAWNTERARPTMMSLPCSLFGAICLQLAQAIEGNRNFIACPVCGKWFELAPGLNRADKQVCSPPCRMRAYRQRQERARQLAAEGKDARAIAKELGSDVATIKGWISKGKGTRKGK
jgi:hypothetical protein